MTLRISDIHNPRFKVQKKEDEIACTTSKFLEGMKKMQEASLDLKSACRLRKDYQGAICE